MVHSLLRSENYNQQITVFNYTKIYWNIVIGTNQEPWTDDWPVEFDSSESGFIQHL